MATLTNEEIRAYEDDGYVVPAYRVPQERIAVLGAAMEEVIAANSDTRPEQLPNIHITNGAGTRLKGHRAFLDITIDEDLLDLVSCVIGDDIVMWGCQIFCKPGSDGMEVPMHQDGQYWPIRPLATCTVWLAIDDSDRENGCLTVIPGSHRDRVHFRHRTRTDDDIVLNQAVDDPRAFDRPSACVELERGQLSMHDIHLIHGSAPNTSGRRRAGVTIRYMPTTSWFRRDLEMPFSGYPSNFADRPIWLGRGRDICGENDFSIGHAEPEPDRGLRVAPGLGPTRTAPRGGRLESPCLLSRHVDDHLDSTGIPPGNDPIPTADRARRPFSPNTSTSRRQRHRHRLVRRRPHPDLPQVLAPVHLRGCSFDL